MGKISSTALAAVAIGLGGCGAAGGSGSSSSSTPPFSGNWEITTTSASHAGPQMNYGSYLMAGNQFVSGHFAHEQDPAGGVIGSVSGTLSGGVLKLTLEDPSGFAMQVTGTISTSETSFSGTYESSGPSPPYLPDSGTLTGLQIPSLAGSWVGTVGSANVTAQLSEQGFDTFGFPNLSGSVVFSGTPCFTSGTVTANQRGQYVNGPGLDGVFTQLAGLIQTDNGTVLLAYNCNRTCITESNPSGTSISLSYLVWSGPCGGTSGSGTLNR